MTGAAAIECPAGYEVVGSKGIHRLAGGYLTHDGAVTYCYQNFGRLPVLPDCASFTDVATYCTSSDYVIYAVCSRTPTDGLCATPYILVGTQCIHLLLTDYSSWSEARTSCGVTGGDLVILDDCYQYSKVTSFLNDQGNSPDGYWIGGSDRALEGQWRWIDGSTMAMGLPYWAN
ncbi:perlucin-like protein, partial [Hyalella azteca]|uniref:Perlucin-like protein n=1 Tax=Hyalella azteca TaxID=294128 RepID=A0A979FKB6_HYAAZ